MDLNQVSALESHDEEILVGAIRRLKPADIIKSRAAVAAIREFFERGTAEDCWQLVPSTHKAVLLGTSPPGALHTLNIAASNPFVSISTDVVSSSTASISCDTLQEGSFSTAPEPCASLHGPSLSVASKSCTAAGISEPLSFLLELNPTGGSVLPSGVTIPDHIRTDVRRLAKAIEGFKAVTPLSPESYETLWSAKEAVFDGPEGGLIGSFCRLQRGRNQMKQAISEYDCAGHLSLMFCANHVDYTVNAVERKLSTGHGRLTAAYKQLANGSATPEKDLKEDYKKCRNFFQVLDEEGPGWLLLVGPNMTALWEKKLTIQNIKDVFQFIAIRLPHLKGRAVLLNPVAASVIVNGLRSCGWIDSDIFSSDTPLIRGITDYLPDKMMEIYRGTLRPPKKRRHRSSNVHQTNPKERTTRSRRSPASKQTHFVSGSVSARTCLSPGWRPSSCSSLAASSIPSSQAIFNDFGHPIVSPSAVDILNSGASSDAVRYAENEGMDPSMADYARQAGELSDTWEWTGCDEFGASSTMDPAMLDYLIEANNLSNHGPGSARQLAQAMDPTMLGYLDMADSLPSTYGPSSAQPSVLTIDPSVLDNLGIAGSQQFPDAENAELGMEAQRHEPAGIMA